VRQARERPAVPALDNDSLIDGNGAGINMRATNRVDRAEWIFKAFTKSDRSRHIILVERVYYNLASSNSRHELSCRRSGEPHHSAPSRSDNMWREDQVWCSPQQVIRRQWLTIGHIQPRTTQMP